MVTKRRELITQWRGVVRQNNENLNFSAPCANLKTSTCYAIIKNFVATGDTFEVRSSFTQVLILVPNVSYLILAKSSFTTTLSFFADPSGRAV